MNESEIVELELATGFSLPSAYRDLLLNYPEQLTALVAAYGEDESGMLFHSKASLSRENVDVEYIRSIFQPQFFIIGESGCGDYYAIDTGNADAPVYIGGPHEGEYPEDDDEKPLPLNESIHSYVEDVIAQYEMFVSEMEGDKGYTPPGKIAGYIGLCFSVCLGIFMCVLAIPIYIIFTLLLMILSGPISLIKRAWDRCRPSQN